MDVVIRRDRKCEMVIIITIIMKTYEWCARPKNGNYHFYKNSFTFRCWNPYGLWIHIKFLYTKFVLGKLMLSKKKLPHSVTRRGKIYEGVSTVFGEGLGRVLVSNCLKNDFDHRGCRARQDLFFSRMLVWICLLISKLFQIHFAQCWWNFLGCSRGFFLVIKWGILELWRVLNRLWFLMLFFQGVNKVLVRGCHWEGQ